MEEKREFEKLLEVMESVMSKAASMHESPHDFGTGVPLYRAEIHTVQAIGHNPGINVTELAGKMDVTKGAVSQTLAKLTRKGLVRKTYARNNAKETLLELTRTGKKGFKNHEKMHMQMFDTVREHFGGRFKARLKAFISVMKDLDKILDKYEEQIKGG